MATNQLGLNAAQLIAELAKVQAEFQNYNNTLQGTANTIVQLNNTQKGISGTFKQIAEDGTKLVGTLVNVNGAWEAQAKSIQVVNNALKQQQAAAAAAARQQQQLQAAALRQTIGTALPVPTGASLSGFNTYQASINSLISLTQRLKIPIAEVQAMFAKLQRNPFQDLSRGSQDLAQVQQALNRVVLAHQNLNKAQDETNTKQVRANRTWTEFFARIAAVHLVHRLFSAIISGFQQSVTAAAELQVQISAIRTVSQQSGLSFENLQGIIRRTSEEFSRPQIDVAAALYQGFQDQVIKSANDLSVLNEAMRLSQITMASAKDSMALLGSVINAYRFETFEASKITDQLFKAIELGRFSAAEVANSLGRVTVVASQVGIKFEEVAGLLANLTRSGVNAHEAMTQISSITQALLRPSEDMKKIFKEWGVETGIQAVQTFGFVGVLERLSNAAASGKIQLSDIIHNVRALRAIMGATQGGGVSDLQADIDAIRGAGPSADRATEIIRESAGARFKKELIEIQNFFTNDFANKFLETIEKLTGPFGGLSESVKQLGDGLLQVMNVGIEFFNVFNNIVTLGGNLNTSLTQLIQIYIAVKVAILAYHLTLTAANTITTLWEATNKKNTATLFANLGAVSANTVGVAANTVATTTNTIAQRAWTLALIAARAALIAIPFVAIAVIVADLTGAFKPWIDQITGATAALRRLEEQTKKTNEEMEKNDKARTRLAQRSLDNFRGEADAIGQQINLAFAELNRQIQQSVDQHKESAKAALTVVKEDVAGANKIVADRVAKTKRDIDEIDSAIRRSRARQLSFADRDASQRFQSAFRAASRGPEVLSGLRPRTPQEEQVESLRRSGEASTFQQQQFLIQRRLMELQADAQRLQASGNQQDMESARRKYEEIRRLTQQLWELETERARTQATQSAEDLARTTGGIITSTYQVNLQKLQAMLDEVRAREEAAEASFRQKQQQEQERAQTRLREQQAQQRRLTSASRALTEFSVTDRSGDVLDRFRGAGGIGRLREDFAERIRQFEIAARAAGLTEAEIQQAVRGTADYRLRLEEQVQRQITQITLRETQARVTAEREAIVQARQQAEGRLASGRQEITSALRNLPEVVATMRKRIEESIPSFWVQFLDPTGSNAALAASTESKLATFRRQQALVEEARAAFEAARGTVGEAEAMAQLRGRVEQLTQTYREFLHLHRNRTVGDTGRTGAELQQEATPAADPLRRITAARDQMREATRQVRDSEEALLRLNQQVASMPGSLIPAMLGINQFGEVLNQQRAGVESLADAIRDLANQIAGLAGSPRRVVPRDFVGPLAPNESFASGGLIGNRFTGRGSDDRLIFAKTGEFVINPESSRRFYSQLVAINSGKVPHFAQGGMVQSTYVGDISINVSGAEAPDVTARAVLGKLKREFRRGNGRI